MRPKRDPGGAGALVSIKAGIVGEEPWCRWRRTLLPFTPIGQSVLGQLLLSPTEFAVKFGLINPYQHLSVGLPARQVVIGRPSNF
jgi:hypothetical protein